MEAKIDHDIKLALKQGDKTTAEALRFLKSILINARISAGHDLTEQEAVKVIRKEIKSRIEARDMYKANKRDELANKEESERQLYIKYVPQELTQDEIIQIVDEAAKDFDEPLDFGKLMSAVMQKIAGRADGQAVAMAVKMYLSKKV